MHGEEISRRTANNEESIFKAILTLEPPSDPAPNVLDEIPRDDMSYRFVRMNLVPHRRIPDLFLLRYRTFIGRTAYQPCAKDIDLTGIFEVIQPVKKRGDPVFKAARSWSCVVQASEILPKDIRWVLSLIYNLSHEMLNPRVNDDVLWKMRPWLMYWYDVIDRLFNYYGIFASAPEPNWFKRPRPLRGANQEAVHNDDRAQRRHTTTATSTTGGTVIHHATPRRDRQAASTRNIIPQSQSVSAIQSWLSTLPNSSSDGEHEIFDPTPSGAVSSKNSPATSSSSIPVAKSPQLNPNAITFHPRE
jgi:hypothetical protein